MSNQKPDGWVQISPEGEYCGDDERFVVDRFRPKAKEFKQCADDGYLIKPICLIDPQELTQLRKIETIAKSVVEIMWLIDDAKIPLPRVRAGFFRDTYLALSEALSAITAPVEAKPEPKMHTDAFGQPLIGRAKQ